MNDEKEEEEEKINFVLFVLQTNINKRGGFCLILFISKNKKTHRFCSKTKTISRLKTVNRGEEE